MTETGPDKAMQDMLDDLVVAAEDDWVMLLEVDAIVTRDAARRGHELDAASRIRVGVDLIRLAIERGLMVPGDVVDPRGFEAWDLDRETGIQRIVRGWNSAGLELGGGDVCWLANTPAGDAYAEDVRAGVNARSNWG